MQRKVCHKCKAFVTGKTCPTENPDCPVINHNKFSTTYKGKFFIIDPEKSIIAQKLNIKHAGEYAIKTQ